VTEPQRAQRPGPHAAKGRRAAGRRRDTEVGERILEATRELMARHGYHGLTVAAVAEAAGTTRPTVYLRFATKEDLATRAIAGMEIDEPRTATSDVRADLVAELRHFRTGVTRPHGMSFVGTVLAEEHEHPALLEHFRERLVAPRRARIGAVLDRGQRLGTLRADLDVEVLTTALIGGLYAGYLADSNLPPDWPERAVDALWPALVAPA
jgi:AcrR family transcriptional regulator